MILLCNSEWELLRQDEMENKIWLGSLLLIFLASGIVYVQYDDFKIRFSETTCKNDGTLSVYYIKNSNSLWTVNAKEFGGVFDGSSKMNRNVSSIKYSYFLDSGSSVFVQKAEVSYLRGVKEVHTWYFDGSLDNIEFVPVYHDIEVFNAEGKFYRYEVRNLKGVNTSENIVSPVQFGRIKLNFQDGYNWAKSYKTGGIVKVQYKISSDYFKMRFNLVDPEVFDVKKVNKTLKYDNLCLDWINVTESKLVSVEVPFYFKENKTIGVLTNYTEVNYSFIKCVGNVRVVNYDNRIAVLSKLQVGYDGNNFVFDDVYDGNGDGICSGGESCCIILEDSIRCMGYNANKIKSRFSKEWMEIG